MNRSRRRLLQLAPLLLAGGWASRARAALVSFFADASARGAHTAALRDYLGALPATRRVVLVTHMVNITALTGESPTMGEALIVRSGASGTGDVPDWPRVD